MARIVDLERDAHLGEECGGARGREVVAGIERQAIHRGLEHGVRQEQVGHPPVYVGAPGRELGPCVAPPHGEAYGAVKRRRVGFTLAFHLLGEPRAAFLGDGEDLGANRLALLFEAVKKFLRLKWAQKRWY